MKWMRRVVSLPVLSIVLLALLCVYAISFIYMPEYFREALASIAPVCILLVYLSAIYYAVIRAYRFNPFYDTGYATWLRATPWTTQQPLPVLPLHPVWQDGIVMLLFVGVAALYSCPAAWFVPAAMAWTYTVVLAPMFLFLGFRAAVYGPVILTLLWLSFLDHPTLLPPLSLLLSGAIAWMSGMFCREAIRRFPWGMPVLLHKSLPLQAISRQSAFPYFLHLPNRETLAYNEARIYGIVAFWPLNLLHGKRCLSALSTCDRVLIPILCGWGWLLLSLFASREFRDSLPVLLCFVVIQVPLMHACIGANTLALPISFFGRLATGRLIIPRFDRIFRGTLLSGLCGWQLPGLLIKLGISEAVAFSLTLTTSLFLWLFLGVTYNQQRLTGACRLTNRTWLPGQ